MSPLSEPETPSAERLAIAEARSAIGNPISDPEKATRHLLEQAEQGLSRRADVLEQRFKKARFRLSLHANRSIAAKDAIINPKFSELSRLQKRGESLTKEVTEILDERDKIETSKRRRQQVNTMAKAKFAELESLKSQMDQTIAPVDASLKKMEAELEIAAPLWTGIQGSEKLAFRLRLHLAWARFQSFLLRLSFLLVAFGLAVAVDRYTSVAELGLAWLPSNNRHDGAISLLFFAQALLFEPFSLRLRSKISARVHSSLTNKAEDLLMKIEQFERQLSNAEPALRKLEASVP